MIVYTCVKHDLVSKWSRTIWPKKSEIFHISCVKVNSSSAQITAKHITLTFALKTGLYKFAELSFMCQLVGTKYHNYCKITKT